MAEFGSTGATSRSMQSPATLRGWRRDGRVFPIEATISQATIRGNKLHTVPGAVSSGAISNLRKTAGT